MSTLVEMAGFLFAFACILMELKGDFTGIEVASDY